jgi:hypothetical protein
MANVRHYLWAGLDFMFDGDDAPVLIEANKSSHMLYEYRQFVGDERPFELVAAAMNTADGPPCVLWRACEPLPGDNEDAPFITRGLTPFLKSPPLIGNVEDNQAESPVFRTRDGQSVRPGSLFRWWYGLPWSYERAGVRVINPNAVWVVVRDKLRCNSLLRAARAFRVPLDFAVESPADVLQRRQEHPDLFRNGYVLKPRLGWGGYGVQVAEPHDPPQPFSGGGLLAERIRPRLIRGRYWVVRAFVMAGEYLGGVRYTSTSAVTNYWQGGEAEPLDAATSERLREPALEAVRRLDSAAAEVFSQPSPPSGPLTNVNYG